MEFNFDLLSALAGALVVLIPAGLVVHFQPKSHVVKSEHLIEKIKGLEEQIKTMKEDFEKQLDYARKELSIEAFAYEDVNGDDGWVVDDRSAEVGYKYQLFIKGIPCFEPHKVVIKKVEKKEVNPEKLRFLKTEVLDMLETIATKHPAFRIAQKAGFAR